MSLNNVDAAILIFLSYSMYLSSSNFDTMKTQFFDESTEKLFGWNLMKFGYVGSGTFLIISAGAFC